MVGVNEIEEAVQRLSPAELEVFRAWFAEFDAIAWDRQMEDDVAAGRLDALAEEALDDLRAGRCTDR
jgi:predicted transcriptional regulator